MIINESLISYAFYSIQLGCSYVNLVLLTWPSLNQTPQNRSH